MSIGQVQLLACILLLGILPLLVVILLLGGVKKQGGVARSSVEAEFHGMSQRICELLWLKTLMRDLGFELEKPKSLYCDIRLLLRLLIILCNMIVRSI